MTSSRHRIIASHAINIIAQLRELEELRERVKEAELSAPRPDKTPTKKVSRCSPVSSSIRRNLHEDIRR
jgi:hypothetical protein